jgi:type II secretory pathway component GspD/PulD (secretin)
MFRFVPLALVLALAPCIAARAWAADEPARELTLQLTQIEAKNAATLLRTIADVKKLRAVDEHTIVVSGTAEELDAAAAVVRIADVSEARAADERFTAGDGAVIIGVKLENAFTVDVMQALRMQLRIARLATLGEKRIFLRDTEKQIAAALEVISDLDSPASH